ncbi:hypothetical protein P3W85_02610 [Cupriavidus basilensis]|uniref:Uncharacterized protein n=1 Tax=Cupriavidus basilensis TaxID=68895 RepID=A0ABT6AHI0_9BURK|nr:hypothetical protein [Cupriavidus basilensis]MDF3831853.1 hypothetical protein [Cupriavidus basilensis]
MFPRSLLRDSVAGIVLAVSVLGLNAASHAQVAFWQHSRPEARNVGNVPVQGGWEMASVRAERQDHVRAQIERMEARARADDRLNGRPSPPERDDERGRQPGHNGQGDGGRAEQRSPGMGPGWQARGRDGGR